MFSGPKKCSFIFLVLFLAFCLMRLLWVYNPHPEAPLLKPKVPQTSPYGLIPHGSCIASATNQNTDVIWEFDLIISFSHNVNLFRLSFGHFWPPTVPQTGPKVPIWTLTSKSIIWVWNQPKNGLLLLMLFFFIAYLSWWFLAIFSLWGPFGGLLGPCHGLLCPTGIHMELGPQVCHFRW